ncbi:MAG: hypothetical protein JZU67_00810 [Burkholderiaceae bacterium]|nr:hypothetical protein [Burkholderiaceae bacterium]
MPNWCQQYGEVRGPDKDIKRFIEAMRIEQTEEWKAIPDWNRNEWDMNQLFPIPTELHETVSGYVGEEKAEEHSKQQESNLAKYGYKDWYDWANANWDTKWGACNVEFDEDSFFEEHNSIILHWESAWSPAVGLLKNISAQFPELVFGMHFTEEADFFAGFMVFHKGEMVAEGEHGMEGQPEYDDDDENWDEKYSEWKDALTFEIAEGMATAMTSQQIFSAN